MTSSIIDFSVEQMFCTTERQLSTISYTLASEKYFVKLYNRSTVRKLDLSCGIEVYHVERLL